MANQIAEAHSSLINLQQIQNEKTQSYLQEHGFPASLSTKHDYGDLSMKREAAEESARKQLSKCQVFLRYFSFGYTPLAPTV